MRRQMIFLSPIVIYKQEALKYVIQDGVKQELHPKN